MVEQTTVQNKSHPPVKIYAESETKFFSKAKDPFELTFVNDDKGQVAKAIVHYADGFVRQGKKLN